MQTTELLGSYFSLPPSCLIVEKRLRVQSFGTYEGKDYDEYKSLFTSQKEMLEGNAPEGEPGVDVFERTRKFLYHIAKQSEKNVLVVTHAFNYCHINKCLTGKYGSLPKTGEYTLYDFSAP